MSTSRRWSTLPRAATPNETLAGSIIVSGASRLAEIDRTYPSNLLERHGLR